MDSENEKSSLVSKTMKVYYIKCYFCFLLLILCTAASAQNIKGRVTEADTTREIAFAFVVNKKTGNGTVADGDGRFSIAASLQDTLVFSALGYLPRKIPAAQVAGKSVSLFPKVQALPEVVVGGQRMSINERRYIERFINVPKPDFSSPVSALYEQFSREGKSREKLRQLYEHELYLEDFRERCLPFFRQKKINLAEFDVDDFCFYCKLTPDFVRRSDNYSFFFAISRCFDSYTGKVSDR
jgi:hypothetical protein